MPMLRKLDMRIIHNTMTKVIMVAMEVMATVWDKGRMVEAMAMAMV